MTIKTEPLNGQVFKLMGVRVATREYTKAYGGQGTLYRWVDSLGKDLPSPLSFEEKSVNEIKKHLPLIHENFQLTLDWLVPFMREQNYYYEIEYEDDAQFFTWGTFESSGVPGMEDVFYFKNRGRAEITDDKVAKAACLAALPILKKLWEKDATRKKL